MKTLICKLERNRSDRRRYVRYVKYVRNGNTVTPVGIRDGTERALPWGLISATSVDPEFQSDWMQHVRGQAGLP